MATMSIAHDLEDDMPMQRYAVTVTVYVQAENDTHARGVIDQALDEWCNADHDEDDPEEITSWGQYTVREVPQ